MGVVVVDDLARPKALHLNNSAVGDKLAATAPPSSIASSSLPPTTTTDEAAATPATDPASISASPPPADDPKEDREDDESTDSNSSDERYPDDDLDDPLVKPMPVLGVCPMDMIPASAFDKPTPMMHMATPIMPPLPMNMHTINSPQSSALQPHVLKRDPLAIRHQYWNQLGINPSMRDVERSTGRRRINREGIKVKLNDIKGKKKPTNIFKAFSRWYTNESTSDVSDDALTAAVAASPPSPPITPADDAKETTASIPQWLLQGQLTPPTIIKDTNGASPPRPDRSIRFEDEADLFYIPVHKEFSKRQRDSMWYSREEFITMVERNLDEMYEEMEAEYEQQAKMEAAENDAMAAEEARQRAVDAAIKQQQMETKQHTVHLRPENTQVRLQPRGRSPSEIRFKYLKHLGI
ncbi:Aste57867_22359 [Aphanomyces stellatus]|uniref:Aste57867_22359 protein n=1 Tax=Aphanomyces stellatus TaxID=120398 RepID=A0A485LJW1_9STRA|nr:hypothetical protein As57867_022289 [Aphanomyces stellatus]VFT99022.1 Aste57867_22359 [Aphanomyces stellatus]